MSHSGSRNWQNNACTRRDLQTKMNHFWVKEPQKDDFNMNVATKQYPHKPHTPFSTAPMSPKYIFRAINPPNPDVRCPTVVKMYFRLWQYLTPCFPPPPCPQNAFSRPSTTQTPMLDVPLSSNCISGCSTTSCYVVQCILLVRLSRSSFFAIGDTSLQNMHATRHGKPCPTHKGEKPSVPAKLGCSIAW